jgi:hypothetical protein
MKYKAVTRDELIAELGNCCSPDNNRDKTAYVIGPDLNGRLCHIATCKGGIVEAQLRAEKLNSETK